MLGSKYYPPDPPSLDLSDQGSSGLQLGVARAPRVVSVTIPMATRAPQDPYTSAPGPFTTKFPSHAARKSKHKQLDVWVAGDISDTSSFGVQCFMLAEAALLVMITFVVSYNPRCNLRNKLRPVGSSLLFVRGPCKVSSRQKRRLMTDVLRVTALTSVKFYRTADLGGTGRVSPERGRLWQL